MFSVPYCVNRDCSVFEVTASLKLFGSDLTQSLLTIGALTYTTSCYTYHDDVVSMQQGLCDDGMYVNQ